MKDEAPAAADGYRTDWLQQEQAEREPLLRLLAQVKRQQRLSRGRVLELGSGLGRNLQLFRADNQVLGLEAMAQAVAQARASGVPSRCVDLERQDWGAQAPGPWNAVLLIDVLEHVVEPLRLLEQAAALLSPGGVIVVNLPNHFDWRARLRMLRGAGIDAPAYFPTTPAWHYPHLRLLRHGDALALLQTAGLRVVDDLSCRQSSLPKARYAPRLAAILTRQWPALLASGFLLVAVRRVEDLPGPAPGSAAD